MAVPLQSFFCNFLGRLHQSRCPSNVLILNLIPPCHSAHSSQHPRQRLHTINFACKVGETEDYNRNRPRKCESFTRQPLFCQSEQPVDVLRYIDTALRCGRVVLTLPWVVEYLSMVDALASCLSYFTRLFKRLLVIHR